MDKNDNDNTFSDVQSSQPDPGVTPDKAFSDSVGTPVPAAAEAPAKPANTSPKHKAPVGAIILAVIVAGALAAATIFAYRQSNKPAADDQAGSNQTSDTVSGSDVDATAEEIDQTVNEMDSASDFVESELSDTTLGL